MKTIATYSTTSSQKVMTIITTLYKHGAPLGKARIRIAVPIDEKRVDEWTYECDLEVWAYDNEAYGWLTLYDIKDFGKDWVKSVVEKSGKLVPMSEAFALVNDIQNRVDIYESVKTSKNGWNHLLCAIDSFLLMVDSQYRLL
jgi:hypothetical protein